MRKGILAGLDGLGAVGLRGEANLVAGLGSTTVRLAGTSEFLGGGWRRVST